MRAPRLGVLDRYVVREVAGPFLLGTALLTVVLLLDRLYQLTELVIGRGVPPGLVAPLLLFLLPPLLVHALPLALLVAVLLAGGRLAADREVLALRASGVGPLRLLRPVLLAAAGVAVVTAALTLGLVPGAGRLLQAQLVAITQARLTAGLRERVFTGAFDDVVIYVEDMGGARASLRGILVADERDPRRSRVITARRGHLLADGDGRRVTLRLVEGSLGEAERLRPEPGDGPARYRHAVFGLYDMALPVVPALGGDGDRPERDLGLGELLARQRAAGDRPAWTRARLELHRRLALPLAPLLFALIGFPLAMRALRGGRSAALVGALAVLVTYHLLMSSLEAVALRGALPPGLAVWLPGGLLAALGLLLLAAAARRWRLPATAAGWQAVEAGRQRLARLGRRRASPASPSGRGRRPGSLVIDRYLLRQYGLYLGWSLAVAAALVIVVDLLETLDRYLRARPPLGAVAEHFVWALPGLLLEALPAVMLVGTLFLFLTLGRRQELTALHAAGVSLHRAAAPVLGLALLVTLGAGLVQEFVLPVLNERREHVDRVKIRGLPPRHLQSRARLWLRAGEGRFYRVELLDPAGAELHGLTLLELDHDFQLRRRLDVRHARWTPAGWQLRDGTFRWVGPDGHLQSRPFAGTTLALPETIADFTAVQKPTWSMSYRELRDYVGRLREAGVDVARYQVDMQARLADPWRNLVLVLVAIPLARLAPGGGRLHGVGLAVGVMAGYLVLDHTARALARADLLPAALGAWTASVIVGGLGTALLLRART